jgi:hypothetical protein
MGTLHADLSSVAGMFNDFGFKAGSTNFDSLAMVDSTSDRIIIQSKSSQDNQPLWTFIFNASPIGIGKIYDNALFSPNSLNSNGFEFPSVFVTSFPDVHVVCSDTSSQFTVEQEVPTLTISFTAQCGRQVPDRALRGKITFTPNIQLTSIPGNLFKPIKVGVNGGPYPMTFEVDSQSGDFLGGGFGKDTFSGQAYTQAVPSQNVFYPISEYQFRFAKTTGNDIKNWVLVISAPFPLEVGKTYSNVAMDAPGSPFSPEFTIYYMQAPRRCPSGVAQFSIAQQSPTLVISFSLQCDPAVNATLTGKLTFAPQ